MTPTTVPELRLLLDAKREAWAAVIAAWDSGRGHEASVIYRNAVAEYEAALTDDTIAAMLTALEAAQAYTRTETSEDFFAQCSALAPLFPEEDD